MNQVHKGPQIGMKLHATVNEQQPLGKCILHSPNKSCISITVGLDFESATQY